jgi:putative transposase
MPRHARFTLAGIALHIVARGHNRAPCFRVDADRERYLHELAEAASRYDCAIHAYCLMTNHVHLLATPTSASSAARMMKDVGQRHTQYFNYRYERIGTLWEGRFRSSLVQSSRYALACYRYIESNPVRAGMVDRPDAYRWSSYAVNGLGRACDWLRMHAEYESLGADERTRRAAYRSLFTTAETQEEGIERIRRAVNGGFVLGDAAFEREVARKLGRRVVAGRAGRPATAATDVV